MNLSLSICRVDIITSSNSSKKLDYLGGDDYDDDFHSSIPTPDHSKHTYLTVEELAKVYGSRDPSAQPLCSSPGSFNYFFALIIIFT